MNSKICFLYFLLICIIILYFINVDKNKKYVIVSPPKALSRVIPSPPKAPSRVIQNVPLNNCNELYELFDETNIPINIIQMNYNNINNKWINNIIDNLGKREEYIKSEVKNNNYKPFRLVVCLSTSPKRLSKISDVLNNMLKQSLCPDVIYVFIPKIFKRTNETYNQELINKYNNLSPIIKCTIVDTDYGPITKILPVINYEKDPRTIAVSIDDDTIYDINMLYHYYCKSLLLNDAIITHGSITRWNLFPIIEGYRGIAYRIYHIMFFFDEYNKNYINLSQACFSSDDFIISNMIWLFNFRVYTGPFNLNHVVQLNYNNDSDALHKGGVSTEHNLQNSIYPNEFEKRYFNCSQDIINNNIPLFISYNTSS